MWSDLFLTSPNEYASFHVQVLSILGMVVFLNYRRKSKTQSNQKLVRLSLNLWQRQPNVFLISSCMGSEMVVVVVHETFLTHSALPINMSIIIKCITWEQNVLRKEEWNEDGGLEGQKNGGHIEKKRENRRKGWVRGGWWQQGWWRWKWRWEGG